MRHLMLLSTVVLIAVAGCAAQIPPVPPQSTIPNAPTFTMYVCTSDTCEMSACSFNTFTQGDCLKLSTGGSMMAGCADDTTIYFSTFPKSANCSGTPTQTNDPTHQCIEQGTSTYLEFVCSGGSGSGGNHSHSGGSGSHGSGSHKSGSGSVPHSGSGSQPGPGAGLFEDPTVSHGKWAGSKLQAALEARFKQRRVL
jgi:hypothetical protein